jgi:3,4-dihydroxy 2-butanone 4-phosphate synthase / GTP cyclohydrolase II
VDANLDLGLPADARDFSVGAQILGDLGITSVRLLTNNPAKRVGVEEHGLTVLEQVPLEVHITPENIGYLRTKRDRMGHDLPGLDGAGSTTGALT